MKVLMTGATGFIGKALIRELFIRGHDVVILSRHPELAKEAIGFPIEAYSWKAGTPLPFHAFAGVSGVIHLAGEPVAENRWTKDEKEKILKSRILGTKSLVQTIIEHNFKLQFVISASAIGYYGDKGDDECDEGAKPGTGFLAEVCQAWERELLQSDLPAEIRKVIFRIGIVLGQEGGILRKLLPIFYAGVGGKVGSGKQWMSWIDKEDLVRMIVEAAEKETYRGVFNATAPHPVRSEEFAKELSKSVGKPALIPAPAIALRTAFGELSTLMTSGQKVLPKALSRVGFEFKASTLQEALACELPLEFTRQGAESFSQEQWIPKSLSEVFKFFSNARNLEVITPPWLNFEMKKQSTPEITQGTEFDYKISIRNFPISWKTLITLWEPNQRFIDVQQKGPYALWNHEHTFREFRGGVLMKDQVYYKLPIGVLGRAIAGRKIRKDIEEIFSYRLRKIRKIFEK